MFAALPNGGATSDFQLSPSGDARASEGFATRDQVIHDANPALLTLISLHTGETLFQNHASKLYYDSITSDVARNDTPYTPGLLISPLLQHLFSIEGQEELNPFSNSLLASQQWSKVMKAPLPRVWDHLDSGPESDTSQAHPEQNSSTLHGHETSGCQYMERLENIPEASPVHSSANCPAAALPNAIPEDASRLAAGGGEGGHDASRLSQKYSMDDASTSAGPGAFQQMLDDDGRCSQLQQLLHATEQ